VVSFQAYFKAILKNTFKIIWLNKALKINIKKIVNQNQNFIKKSTNSNEF